MGILGKFFGAKPDYPTLDASDPAATYLESVRSPLKKLADMTNDPLEVVPAENTAYIIIGKPPKQFGIAWIEDGKNIVNLKTLVDEKALSPDKLQQLNDGLRKAYITHQEKPRYVTQIGNRDVVIISSSSLLDNLKGVVDKTVN